MARNDFPTAARFEQEARHLAQGAPAHTIFGVKCWYCDASLIESGAERAFIGINPGGKAGDDKYDEQMGYLEAPYEERSFNAWLDEEWPEGNPHQRATRKLFQQMYGDRWESVLRSTACFNTCPFRTTSAKDLSGSLWDASTKWVVEVMNQVRPQLIICNGSGKFRSPWSVITGHYEVDLIFDEEVQANGYLREGTLQLSPLTNVRILGLPFINRFGGHNLFSMIRKIAEARPFL